MMPGLAASMASLQAAHLAGFAGIRSDLGRFGDLTAKAVMPAGLAESMFRSIVPAGLAESMARSVMSGLAASMASLQAAHLAGFAGIRSDLGRYAADIAASMMTPTLADSITKMSMSLAMRDWLADSNAKLDVQSNTSNAKSAGLSREQERFICGYTAYVIVWLLLLQLMIMLANADEAVTAILGITMAMTGLAAPKLASTARDLTFKAYDKFYPLIEK
jgi:hypothetical protein